MKVVALKGFYATHGNVKKGDLIEVTDKIGKSWVKAGLVRAANGNDKGAVVEPHHPLNRTVAEPETAEETGDQPDGDPDKEGETGNDGDAGDSEQSTDEGAGDSTDGEGESSEGGDAPATPADNTNPNQEKASK